MKRTFIAVSAGATILAASLALAAPGHDGARHGGGPHDGRKMERMFDMIDSDGDGLISAAESTAAAEKRARHMFERIDSDDDGAVTLEDMQSMHGRKHGRIEDLDRAALATCIEEEFDGELPDRPEPEVHFAQADSNGDGTLSEDEFVAAAAARAADAFERNDADGNGTLDETEMQARHEERRELHEAMRSCAHEQREAIDAVSN